MVEAIQQAEIDQVEAKYDVLIQEAENNGEDTAALEEEKENKKLEIQKKYADVNFAIKCSQIIADTAVSIMKAYADLGPIAGTVAAVMLAATGVAQLASAKAERDRIKNMSLKTPPAARPPRLNVLFPVLPVVGIMKVVTPVPADVMKWPAWFIRGNMWYHSRK